jgi:hypothetical protein
MVFRFTHSEFEASFVNRLPAAAWITSNQKLDLTVGVLYGCHFQDCAGATATAEFRYAQDARCQTTPLDVKLGAKSP